MEKPTIPHPSAVFPSAVFAVFTPPQVGDDALIARIADAVQGLKSPTSKALIKYEWQMSDDGEPEQGLARRTKILARAAGWDAEIVTFRGPVVGVQISAPR